MMHFTDAIADAFLLVVESTISSQKATNNSEDMGIKLQVMSPSEDLVDLVVEQARLSATLGKAWVGPSL
jgi:hypothetical protein